MSPPQFQNICSWSGGFSIYKKTTWTRGAAGFTGMVVASPEAFYFALDLKRMKAMQGAALGGALGGAIGGLIAGMKKKPEKRKYMPQDVPFVEEMDLTELPAEVVEHPDWPVTWKEGPVIVVPREAVKSIRTVWWMGGIELDMGDVASRTFTPIFKRKKLARYLVEVGWEVAGL